MASLRRRLLLLGPGLLAAVGGAVLSASLAGLVADERAQAEAALRVNGRVVERLVRLRGQRLGDGLGALAAEPRLREAAASGDRATARQILVHHAVRLGADVAQLADTEGRLLAVAGPPGQQAGAFAFGRLARPSMTTPEAFLVLAPDGPAQVAVTAVPAATPVGWLALGQRADGRWVHELADVSGAEVALWSPSGGGILASSFGAGGREDLGILPGPLRAGGRNLGEVAIGDRSWVAAVLPLAAADPGEVAVVVLRPLRSPWQIARQRLAIPFLVLLLGLVATAGVCLLLARRLARGAREIEAMAEALADGRDDGIPTLPGAGGEWGGAAVALGRMVQAVRSREEGLRHRALHDELTGLPNRARFHAQLERGLAEAGRRGGPLAVLLLDLDGFKDLNDALGHEAGDHVLRQAGERLSQAVRENDTVARLGGDEFAVLLPDSDRTRAARVAAKLAAEVQEPIDLGEMRVELGASVGIAVFPQHGEEASLLLQRADLARRQAREAHRGPTVFRPRGDEPTRERLSLVAELRRAVARSELVLHYQPKVELVGGRLRQVEALVRWQHPTRGLLAPSEFVPLAERTGHIRLITRWTIDEAVRQAAEWATRGLGFGVAVNLSALDLLDSELASSIYRPLMRHGLPPSRLVLEITETAMMRETHQLVALVEELREAGVRLAIDDFGTGWSSLSLLRRLAVHELKIDKSFVTHMVERPDDLVVVRSTIDLGHNLGLEVVAEGIEAEPCRQELERLGCDLGQGYALGRPMPVSDLVGWLANSGEADRPRTRRPRA